MLRQVPARPGLLEPRPVVPVAVLPGSRLQLISTLASGFVVLLGLVVLIGWAFDVPVLMSAVPGFVTMKPNTAVCFVLLGIALALVGPVTNTNWARVAGRACAALVGMIAFLTLWEYLFSVDFGIDQLLFTEAPGAVATANLGRMGPSTVVAFLMTAGAVLCLAPGASWRMWMGPSLALAAALTAVIALIGDLSADVSSLYAGNQVTQMAIPGSLAFLALAAGIVCARPARGPVRLLSSDTVGGTVVRVIVPVACALPLGLAAGQIAGIYEPAVAIWLLSALVVTVVVPLGWALGETLERAERDRQCVRTLSREAQRDRVAFEEAPIGSVITGRDGRIERVSQAFCGMTGRSPDELIGTDFSLLTHPADRVGSEAMVAALLVDDAGTQHFDKRYLHSSGRIIEGRVALTAILDEDREVAQFFAQIQDVTDARRTSRELEGAQFEMLARLASAAEFHDDETGQHTRRVGELAALVARRLGLSDAQVELLRLAAPLHDVGKIAIPDAVLGKRGKLTAAEFEQMQTHTTIGAQMLTGSTFALLVMAESIALTHHERWDGSGYPHGLAGEEIPMVGRIVAVADVFDALTHSRPYKAAWTTGDALAEMSIQSGRQFDPQVLDVFLEVAASVDHETMAVAS